MSFPLPPKPKSALGYHRTLGPNAGVKVSPLCLGGMSLGDAWAERLGGVSKTTAFEILDYFYDQGGNFIDTASNYQDEQSETWIGEWMEQRGIRDELVIATKYTTAYRTYRQGNTLYSNYVGNNAKNLRHCLEASLKKLRTNFLDILFVHWWDYSTSVSEVMHALHHMVTQGKVLYLGISDTPAWIVSKANEYARANSLTPFVIYQGRWSAAVRDFERDILPMCRMEGMAIHPWGALGGGAFKTKAQREAKGGRNFGPPTEAQIKVSEVLEEIAKRKGTLLTSVALSYVMHKQPYVFPLVGCRSVEHLKGNIKALDVSLSRAEIDEIENAYPFDIGFPIDQFVSQFQDVSRNATETDIFSTKLGYTFDGVQLQQAIPLGIHVGEFDQSKGKAVSG